MASSTAASTGHESPPGLSLIEEEFWYAGAVSERKAEKLLIKKGETGCFLVRDCLLPEADYVLSVYNGKEILHYDVKVLSSSECIFNSYNFQSLSEAVTFYTENRLSDLYLELPNEPIISDADLPKAIGPKIKIAPTTIKSASPLINPAPKFPSTLPTAPSLNQGQDDNDPPYDEIGPPTPKPRDDTSPAVGWQLHPVTNGNKPVSPALPPTPDHFVLGTSEVDGKGYGGGNSDLAGEGTSQHPIPASEIESIYVTTSEIDNTVTATSNESTNDHTYAEPYEPPHSLQEEGIESIKFSETNFDNKDADTSQTSTATPSDSAASSTAISPSKSAGYSDPVNVVPHIHTAKGLEYAIVSKSESKENLVREGEADLYVNQEQVNLNPETSSQMSGNSNGLTDSSSQNSSDSSTCIKPLVLQMTDDHSLHSCGDGSPKPKEPQAVAHSMDAKADRLAELQRLPSIASTKSKLKRRMSNDPDETNGTAVVKKPSPPAVPIRRTSSPSVKPEQLEAAAVEEPHTGAPSRPPIPKQDSVPESLNEVTCSEPMKEGENPASPKKIPPPLPVRQDSNNGSAMPPPPPMATHPEMAAALQKNAEKEDAQQSGTEGAQPQAATVNGLKGTLHIDETLTIQEESEPPESEKANVQLETQTDQKLLPVALSNSTEPSNPQPMTPPTIPDTPPGTDDRKEDERKISDSTLTNISKQPSTSTDEEVNVSEANVAVEASSCPGDSTLTTAPVPEGLPTQTTPTVVKDASPKHPPGTKPKPLGRSKTTRPKGNPKAQAKKCPSLSPGSASIGRKNMSFTEVVPGLTGRESTGSQIQKPVAKSPTTTTPVPSYLHAKAQSALLPGFVIIGHGISPTPYRSQSINGGGIHDDDDEEDGHVIQISSPVETKPFMKCGPMNFKRSSSNTVKKKKSFMKRK